MDIGYYKKYEPIDGKWFIKDVLGRGAFGTVLEIERYGDITFKSALKVITIPPSPLDVKRYREDNSNMDEHSITSYFYSIVKDFKNEVELMLQLKGHNNIVHIEDYDIKKHSDEIGWDIFIRMELLKPMNTRFNGGVVHEKEVIKLGIDVCKALEACQKYKIIHRDIKPSNIFVSDTGDYKLGDFGVARTLDKNAVELSKKGTYTYMAPEVFKNETYDFRADIYSLGLVMYKLLNNNMEPHLRERNHAEEERALSLRMQGVTMSKPVNATEPLGDIILKACAFNPSERFESPARMREALEAILNGGGQKQTNYISDPYGREWDTNDIYSTANSGEDAPTAGIFDINTGDRNNFGQQANKVKRRGKAIWEIVFWVIVLLLAVLILSKWAQLFWWFIDR